MNTTTTFLKKSSQTVMIVASCLHLSHCDSSKDLTEASNANNFEAQARYNVAALEAAPGDVIAFPPTLKSGEAVKFSGFLEEEDNIDETVRSSGQIFSGNFRYNFTNRAAGFRDVEDLSRDEALILRSSDHTIEGSVLEAALKDMQNSSGGIGSLRQALLVDQTTTDLGLVAFTNDEVLVILNAIRSLGHIAKIEDGTLLFIVLSDQEYRLTATSTNQLLIDERKITGTVEQTKFWKKLIFTSEVNEEGEDTGGEYTIEVVDVEFTEVSTGTFEIQLNSL